jgi:hypothetical protein
LQALTEVKKLAMQNTVWGMVLRLASARTGLALVREKLAQPHQKCPVMSDKPQERWLAQELQMHTVLPSKKSVPYLLELLDGTLVNTTALVDQVCAL